MKLEWTGVAVLLVGCACITAGVMCFDVKASVAWVLIAVGVVVAAIGATGWVTVVKMSARRAARSS